MQYSLVQVGSDRIPAIVLFDLLVNNPEHYAPNFGWLEQAIGYMPSLRLSLKARISTSRDALVREIALVLADRKESLGEMYNTYPIKVDDRHEVVDVGIYRHGSSYVRHFYPLEGGVLSSDDFYEEHWVLLPEFGESEAYEIFYAIDPTDIASLLEEAKALAETIETPKHPEEYEGEDLCQVCRQVVKVDFTGTRWVTKRHDIHGNHCRGSEMPSVNG